MSGAQRWVRTVVRLLWLAFETHLRPETLFPAIGVARWQLVGGSPGVGSSIADLATSSLASAASLDAFGLILLAKGKAEHTLCAQRRILHYSDVLFFYLLPSAVQDYRRVMADLRLLLHNAQNCCHHQRINGTCQSCPGIACGGECRTPFQKCCGAPYFTWVAISDQCPWSKRGAADVTKSARDWDEFDTFPLALRFVLLRPVNHQHLSSIF